MYFSSIGPEGTPEDVEPALLLPPPDPVEPIADPSPEVLDNSQCFRCGNHAIPIEVGGEEFSDNLVSPVTREFSRGDLPVSI